MTTQSTKVPLFTLLLVPEPVNNAGSGVADVVTFLRRVFEPNASVYKYPNQLSPCHVTRIAYIAALESDLLLHY
jgi:hypothetical protein